MMFLHFLMSLTFISLVTGACQNECSYSGECVNNKCRCYEGFLGDHCQIDCGCGGHGTCRTDNTCQCDEGWVWLAGQQKCVWDCHCSNGAHCIGPGECGCKPDCQHGECRNGQCQCWEGYIGQQCSNLDTSIMMNKGVPVGMNLGGITYYSSELKFVDIAKLSQEWITQRQGNSAWDTKEHDMIHWRADGYPASLPTGMRVVKLMYRGFGSHEENGDYTVLYDGQGHIEFGLTSNHVKYHGQGRMVVNFPNIQDGGILLKLTQTNPRDPIHNIRLIAPGYENIYDRFPFHPLFLEGLKRYSELRFMDFLHTNAHEPEPTTWNGRRLPDYHTQQGSYGGAVEYMIQLCNILGADPWFNMPHAATNDYVTKFASLVQKTLRPDLKIYIEYSNEVWNGIFRQTVYAKEQGMKLHLDTADYKAGFKYYNKRSSEIMDLWSNVFGAHKNRLVPVWAWQTGYQDYYRQALDDLGNRISKFKAIAVTGYYECGDLVKNHAAEMKHMSMTQMQQFCLQDMSHSQQSHQYFIDKAKQHGVKLVMYEGGPGTLADNPNRPGPHHDDVLSKAIAFHKDDHMERVVHDHLQTWYQTVTKDAANAFPGGLYNYFSYTGTPNKYGSWGMITYTGQDLHTVPKYRGVQKFITEHFPHNPLGPRCSFLQNGAEAHGCYMDNRGSFSCGTSDDNGRRWHTWPSLHQEKGAYLVLDGYNPRTHNAYVRVTDTIAANTYHVFNARTHTWKTVQNFAYHTSLGSKDILPRFPNGVYHNLEGHAHCH